MVHTASVLPVVVWVLSALACVVVVLTRVRLGAAESGGKKTSRLALTLHTVTGAVAAVLWVTYLVTGQAVVGFVGLVLWWVTVLAGLALLMRWMPARGRHASTDEEDDWARGPGLSALAHVGLLLGVLVFTFAFATSAL